jgi:hypothetical protein
LLSCEKQKLHKALALAASSIGVEAMQRKIKSLSDFNFQHLHGLKVKKTKILQRSFIRLHGANAYAQAQRQQVGLAVCVCGGGGWGGGGTP